jgi:hypothetical protein
MKHHAIQDLGPGLACLRVDDFEGDGIRGQIADDLGVHLLQVGIYRAADDIASTGGEQALKRGLGIGRIFQQELGLDGRDRVEDDTPHPQWLIAQDGQHHAGAVGHAVEIPLLVAQGLAHQGDVRGVLGAVVGAQVDPLSREPVAASHERLDETEGHQGICHLGIDFRASQRRFRVACAALVEEDQITAGQQRAKGFEHER